MTPWTQDALWLKTVSTGMWNDPLTWILTIFIALIGTWKIGTQAYQKIWVARREGQITEKGKDAEHRRAIETTMMEKMDAERKQALSEARQSKDEIIAWQKEEMASLKNDLRASSADNKRLAIELEKQRLVAQNYRDQRDTMYDALTDARATINHNLDASFSVNLDQVIALADEASSVQPEPVQGELPTDER